MNFDYHEVIQTGPMKKKIRQNKALTHWASEFRRCFRGGAELMSQDGTRFRRNFEVMIISPS